MGTAIWYDSLCHGIALCINSRRTQGPASLVALYRLFIRCNWFYTLVALLQKSTTTRKAAKRRPVEHHFLKMKHKNNIAKLAGQIALVATAALLNRCLEKRERTTVHRHGDSEKLNRQLTIVSLVYHAIGILYNE